MFLAIPLLLLVLGMGYFVMLKGTEEIGLFKHIGNVIGWLMIGVSVVGLLWMGAFGTACVIKGKTVCPFKMVQESGE